jgi:chromatin segregation and condensation protein Rec8/ScpA/Scc1 (kleisin family)
MSNYSSVVLPGIGAYSKVQSYELKAFSPPPRENTIVAEVVENATIVEIRDNMQTPATDKFEIETLQIPENFDEIIQQIPQHEGDEDSSDPSE